MLLVYLGDMYFGKPKGALRSNIPYFTAGVMIYLISILFDMSDNIIKLLLYSTGLFN